MANKDRLALVASHWPLSPMVQDNLVVLGADGRGDDVQVLYFLESCCPGRDKLTWSKRERALHNGRHFTGSTNEHSYWKLVTLNCECSLLKERVFLHTKDTLKHEDQPASWDKCKQQKVFVISLLMLSLWWTELLFLKLFLSLMLF